MLNYKFFSSKIRAALYQNTHSPFIKTRKYFSRQISSKITSISSYGYMGLIGTNLTIYIAYSLYPEEFLYNNMALCSNNLYSGKIWTLMTHSISHNNLMNLIMDIGGIAILGRVVEKMAGKRA